MEEISMILDSKERVLARAAMRGFIEGGAWREGNQASRRGFPRERNPYAWALTATGKLGHHGRIARQWWDTGWKVKSALQADDTIRWLFYAFDRFNPEELGQRFIPKLLKRCAEEKRFAALAEYLVEFVPILLNRWTDGWKPRMWRNLWVKVDQQYQDPDLMKGLVILDAAVRYRRTYDRDILLYLDPEPRDQILQLLDP